MIFVSLTRLRLRSAWFFPRFAIYAVRSNKQAMQAPGCLKVELLRDRNWTFWTMTAWDSEESVRAYMISGAHKQAMPHMMHWCAEASLARWTQPDTTLPSWQEADRRMRETGRPSKVLHPGPHHADLSYAPPHNPR
jgi:heme-degrading monooxygenase HmoA